MGCCKRFRTTWWPGYSADVIDPDKEFDRQRRFILLKRIVLGIAILALFIGAIYFLVSCTTGSSASSDPVTANYSSASILGLPQKNVGSATIPGALISAKNSTLIDNVTISNDSPSVEELSSSADVSDELNSTSSESKVIDDGESITVVSGPELVLNDNSSLSNETSSVAELNFSNNSTMDAEPSSNNISNSTEDTELLPVSIDYTTGHPLLPSMNNHSHPSQIAGDSQNASDTPSPIQEDHRHTVTLSKSKEDEVEEGWCASSGNLLNCIALSENFKKVTTFMNDENVTHKGAVKGYVMVKTNTSDPMWHPYCSQVWTLETGYKLCNGLGFERLRQLLTIKITDLKQRMHKIGKEVSLQVEDPTKPQAVLLLGSNKNSPSKEHNKLNKSDTNSYDCSVGHITCETL